MPVWDLSLLYSSSEDPQIEKDVEYLEKKVSEFAAKYDVTDKKYLRDPEELCKALLAYEEIAAISDAKAYSYFYFLKDIESENQIAISKLSVLQNRFAKIGNLITFFPISLGLISKDRQDEFLSNSKLEHFKFFLRNIFETAKYHLTVPEEKILNLTSQTSYQMWVSGNEKLLSAQMIHHGGRQIPLSTAFNLVQNLPTQKQRRDLANKISETLKKISPFSEAELNAVVSYKKVNDELRGFESPYQETVIGYQNDPKVVEKLVKVVTENFKIARRFYKVKAKILKQKNLFYSDRNAKIGGTKITFTFDDSLARLKKVFRELNPRFEQILDGYIKNGQIDALPRKGKLSGGYCSGSYSNPTFILLNHIDDLHSFTTFAHEMGHAFHTELSKSQEPLYFGYSMALAETASTLFQNIASESIFSELSDEEKIVHLHDKINDDISTICRQIACFNYEKEIHMTIREKGFLSAEELALLHNKHMSAYLGDAFKLETDDGYFFVQWSHLRRFFYVYSYAYGLLVSKALLAKYKKDKSFWKSIEKFLSAGGSATPEEILKNIGIDVASPEFFLDGLKEIEKDIHRLEELVSK